MILIYDNVIEEIGKRTRRVGLPDQPSPQTLIRKQRQEVGVSKSTGVREYRRKLRSRGVSVCKICGEVKPLSEFRKRKSAERMWYNSYCDDCEREKNREHQLHCVPRERKILTGITIRCTKKTHPSYHTYGGRGIGVCGRWLDKENGLDNFVADVGRRPTPTHQLDRVDNDGDYTPDNCRWVTPAENVRNSSVVRLWTDAVRWIRWAISSGLHGEAEVARMFNVSHGCIWKVVRNKTWIGI